MRNYVSTLAENGLAMAGPAGPAGPAGLVPAPMVHDAQTMNKGELSCSVGIKNHPTKFSTPLLCVPPPM